MSFREKFFKSVDNNDFVLLMFWVFVLTKINFLFNFSHFYLYFFAIFSFFCVKWVFFDFFIKFFNKIKNSSIFNYFYFFFLLIREKLFEFFIVGQSINFVLSLSYYILIGVYLGIIFFFFPNILYIVISFFSFFSKFENIFLNEKILRDIDNLDFITLQSLLLINKKPVKFLNNKSFQYTQKMWMQGGAAKVVTELASKEIIKLGGTVIAFTVPVLVGINYGNRTATAAEEGVKETRKNNAITEQKRIDNLEIAAQKRSDDAISKAQEASKRRSSLEDQQKNYPWWNKKTHSSEIKQLNKTEQEWLEIAKKPPTPTQASSIFESQFSFMDFF